MRAKIFLIVIVLTLLFSSYKKPDQSSYGPWQTFSCYKGLDFAVKKDKFNEYAKKTKWLVKFRNRYRSRIWVSFAGTESSVRSAETKHRFYIDAGSERETYFLLNDEYSINVYADKLVLGQSDNYNYRSCD